MSKKRDIGVPSSYSNPEVNLIKDTNLGLDVSLNEHLLKGYVESTGDRIDKKPNLKLLNFDYGNEEEEAQNRNSGSFNLSDALVVRMVQNLFSNPELLKKFHQMTAGFLLPSKVSVSPHPVKMEEIEVDYSQNRPKLPLPLPMVKPVSMDLANAGIMPPDLHSIQKSQGDEDVRVKHSMPGELPLPPQDFDELQIIFPTKERSQKKKSVSRNRKRSRSRSPRRKRSRFRFRTRKNQSSFRERERIQKNERERAHRWKGVLPSKKGCASALHQQPVAGKHYFNAKSNFVPKTNVAYNEMSTAVNVVPPPIMPPTSLGLSMVLPQPQFGLDLPALHQQTGDAECAFYGNVNSVPTANVAYSEMQAAPTMVPPSIMPPTSVGLPTVLPHPLQPQFGLHLPVLRQQASDEKHYFNSNSYSVPETYREKAAAPNRVPPPIVPPTAVGLPYVTQPQFGLHLPVLHQQAGDEKHYFNASGYSVPKAYNEMTADPNMVPPPIVPPTSVGLPMVLPHLMQPRFGLHLPVLDQQVVDEKHVFNTNNNSVPEAYNEITAAPTMVPASTLPPRVLPHELQPQIRLHVPTLYQQTGDEKYKFNADSNFVPDINVAYNEIPAALTVLHPTVVPPTCIDLSTVLPHFSQSQFGEHLPVLDQQTVDVKHAFNANSNSVTEAYNEMTATSTLPPMVLPHLSQPQFGLNLPRMTLWTDKQILLSMRRSRQSSPPVKNSSYARERKRIREMERAKERERDRRRKGIPPVKKDCVSVCSTTLWLGHVPKTCSVVDISDKFDQFGTILSIDIIHPRGCAYVVMDKRKNANRALRKLKYMRLQGSCIKMAWAPGKGVKGEEFKDYWKVDLGVSYIPFKKIKGDIETLELLEKGGFIDEDSLSEHLKALRQQSGDGKDSFNANSNFVSEANVAFNEKLAPPNVVLPPIIPHTTVGLPMVLPQLGLHLPGMTVEVEKEVLPMYHSCRSSSPIKNNSCSRERGSIREKERERDQRRKGMPPIIKGYVIVCSTTLWLGHIPKSCSVIDISDMFGQFGTILSIDMIPPRGCAYVVMDRRKDAIRALQKQKNVKLKGSCIKLAWAPGKGVTGKEFKEYWQVDFGVSYIPYEKIKDNTTLELLEEGGFIDEDSLPEYLKGMLLPQAMLMQVPMRISPPPPTLMIQQQSQEIMDNQSQPMIGGVPSLVPHTLPPATSFTNLKGSDQLESILPPSLVPPSTTVRDVIPAEDDNNVYSHSIQITIPSSVSILTDSSSQPIASVQQHNPLLDMHKNRPDILLPPPVLTAGAPIPYLPPNVGLNFSLPEMNPPGQVYCRPPIAHFPWMQKQCSSSFTNNNLNQTANSTAVRPLLPHQSGIHPHILLNKSSFHDSQSFASNVDLKKVSKSNDKKTNEGDSKSSWNASGQHDKSQDMVISTDDESSMDMED